jgi:hypothetical protein
MSFTYRGFTLNSLGDSPWYNTEITLFEKMIDGILDSSGGGGVVTAGFVPLSNGTNYVDSNITQASGSLGSIDLNNSGIFMDSSTGEFSILGGKNAIYQPSIDMSSGNITINGAHGTLNLNAFSASTFAVTHGLTLSSSANDVNLSGHHVNLSATQQVNIDSGFGIDASTLGSFSVEAANSIDMTGFDIFLFSNDHYNMTVVNPNPIFGYKSIDATAQTLTLSAIGSSNSIALLATGPNSSIYGQANIEVVFSGGDSTILIEDSYGTKITGRFGCNGQTPQAPIPVGGDASSEPGAEALANNLKNALIAFGIATT